MNFSAAGIVGCRLELVGSFFSLRNGTQINNSVFLLLVFYFGGGCKGGVGNFEDCG